MNLDHPTHYNQHPSGIECINVCETLGFNLGNAVKYAWRAPYKHDNALDDVRKALRYVVREIEAPFIHMIEHTAQQAEFLDWVDEHGWQCAGDGPIEAILDNELEYAVDLLNVWISQLEFAQTERGFGDRDLRKNHP